MSPPAVLLHVGLPVGSVGAVRTLEGLLPRVGTDVSGEDPRLAEHAAAERTRGQGTRGGGGMSVASPKSTQPASSVLKIRIHLQQRWAP